MKKYILPSALILLLGLGLAAAQTINKAIQLSQDATGAFAVDTNQGVYFPGHVLSANLANPTPTVTAGGVNTPSITGTDFAGTVTMGTSATTANVIFGRAYLSVPQCVLSWPSVIATETYVLATTSIQITQTSTSGNKINYICSSLN